jgi:hypothetical protein
MLWPEKREKDAVLGDKIPGVIDRTKERSWIRIPAGFQPSLLKPLRKTLHAISPDLVNAAGDIALGPIPAGVPVDLLANLRPLPESSNPLSVAKQGIELANLLLRLQLAIATLPKDATDAQLLAKLQGLAGPMMALSKCPDFIVNRGHYFGTSLFAEEPALSDGDKQALIAFLKTF